jgi:TolA-binding protein
MNKIIVAATIASAALATGVSAQPAVAPAPAVDITRAASTADAERQFARLDANHDGQLDAAEMQQIAEQRRAERRQRIEERMAQMSPGDRALFEQRRAEWALGGQRGGREGGQRAAGGGERGAAWARGGGDGERGPVTLAQFRAQAEARFDRLDLNHDGVITAAEQAQLRAQRGTRTRD